MTDLLNALSDGDDRQRAIAAAQFAHASRRWPKGAVAALMQAVQDDPCARARSAALNAIVVRARPARAVAAWRLAITDDTSQVRLRAAQLSAKVQLRIPNAVETLAAALLNATDDHEPLVVEAACFALGEVILHESLTLAVGRLSHLTLEHDDPLIREAAVAALGSIGDDEGLPAVLEACRDKPAIRRRAVLALAAFEGDEVDAALETALGDHDWQVRQAAEDLTGLTHDSD